MFQDGISDPFKRIKIPPKNFLGFLGLEDGTDTLFRNVDTKPNNAIEKPKERISGLHCGKAAQTY
jgi:hypothetical protein